MGPAHDFSYEKKHEFIGVDLDFFAAEPSRKLMYEGEFSSDESSSTSKATSCFLFLTEGESLDQLWSVAGCCLLGYCSDCLEVNPVQVFSFSRFFGSREEKGDTLLLLLLLLPPAAVALGRLGLLDLLRACFRSGSIAQLLDRQWVYDVSLVPEMKLYCILTP